MTGGCHGCGIPIAACSRPECEVARLKAQLAAARRVIEAADAVRQNGCMTVFGGVNPYLGRYDAARAEFAKVYGVEGARER